MGTWLDEAGLVAPVEVAADWPVDFTNLYRTELASVTGVVYAICGNRWAAEDLAHDAFLIAHRHWERIAEYEVPIAFVRRVAINLARSRLRRLAAETRALARYALRQGAGAAELVGLVDEFWTEVRRLPGRQAEVMVLRHVAELTDVEISEVLGCAESTVRVHAHRARNALAARFEGWDAR